jgi:hypothetical protein
MNEKSTSFYFLFILSLNKKTKLVQKPMKSIKEMFYINELSIFGFFFSFKSLSSLWSQNSIGVKREEKKRRTKKDKQQEQ